MEISRAAGRVSPPRATSGAGECIPALGARAKAVNSRWIVIGPGAGAASMATAGDGISLRPLSLRPGGGTNPFKSFGMGAGVGLKHTVCFADGMVCVVMVGAWVELKFVSLEPGPRCKG